MDDPQNASDVQPTSLANISFKEWCKLFNKPYIPAQSLFNEYQKFKQQMTKEDDLTGVENVSSELSPLLLMGIKDPAKEGELYLTHAVLDTPIISDPPPTKKWSNYQPGTLSTIGQFATLFGLSMAYANPQFGGLISGIGSGLLMIDQIKGLNGLKGLQLTAGSMSVAGSAADMARGLFFGKQAQNDSGLTNTINQTYDSVANAAMMFAPVGTIVGGAMKVGAFVGDAMQALGGGTDLMTTTDQLMDSSLFSWNVGLINGFAGKRTQDFSANQQTLEQVGSSYGGSVSNINQAAEHAGKKYGLFSSGSRNRWNNRIDSARQLQNLMTDIANDAADLRYMASSDVNHLNYNYNMAGGYDLRYMRAAKLGGVLRKFEPGGKFYGQLGVDYGTDYEPITLKDIEIYPKYRLKLDTYYPLISEFFPGHSILYLQKAIMSNDGLYTGLYTTIGSVDMRTNHPGYDIVTNNCSDATGKALQVAFSDNTDSSFLYNPNDITTPGKIQDEFVKHGAIRSNNKNPFRKGTRGYNRYEERNRGLSSNIIGLSESHGLQLLDYIVRNSETSRAYRYAHNNLGDEELNWTPEFKSGGEIQSEVELSWQPEVLLNWTPSFKQGGELEYEIELNWELELEEPQLDWAPLFKEGGKVQSEEEKELQIDTTQMNVIPEGALHKNKHHIENTEEYTQKGIPVIDVDGEQQAEIECNEIIFTLEVTQKLESWYREFYNEETSNSRKDEVTILAGKLLVEQILYNTDDRTGLIDTLKRGGNIPKINKEIKQNINQEEINKMVKLALINILINNAS